MNKTVFQRTTLNSPALLFLPASPSRLLYCLTFPGMLYQISLRVIVFLNSYYLFIKNTPS
jgi:hypothetical protein